MTDLAQPAVRSPKRAEIWAKRALSRANPSISGLGIGWVNVMIAAAGLGLSVVGNGVHDDTAGIQAVVNHYAGTGVSVWFPAGSYLVSAPITIPTGKGLHLYAVKGTATLVSTMTPSVSTYANSVFIGVAQPLVPAVGTTLSTNATVNARTLALTAAAGFAVGQTILASRGILNLVQQFTIQSFSGGGLTAHVDDPVEFSFQAGDSITAVTVPSNVIIEGLSFTGTGDRAVELSAATSCILRDLTVTRASGSFTWIVLSFDTGGRRNLGVGCLVDGGGIAAACYGSESQVDTEWAESHGHDAATGSANAGFFVPGGARVRFTGCRAWACGNGMLASDVGDADGVKRLQLTDCQFYGNTLEDLLLQACKNFQLTNVVCSGSTDGLYLSSGVSAGACNGLFANLTITDESGRGINWATLGHAVQGTNLTIDRTQKSAIYFNGAGTLDVEGFESTDANLGGTEGGPIYFNAAADCVIKCGRVSKVASTALWTITDAQAGWSLVLDDYVVSGPGAGGTSAIVDMNNPGKLRLRDVRTVGAVTFGLVTAAAAVIVRILEGCQLESCVTPTSYGAGTMINRGTVIANGVNAVAVPFTDIGGAGRETVKLTSTATSAVGSAYLFSQTPGTGFSIKSQAGDANTYDYEIS